MQGGPIHLTLRLRFALNSPEELVRRLGDCLLERRRYPASRVIADEVWLAVVNGELETGSRLPTARELAIALGVMPRSVDLAYRALEERGVVVSRAGEGTFVSLRPPPEAELEKNRAFSELCQDAYEQALELGFSLQDLLDALADYRTADRVQQ